MAKANRLKATVTLKRKRTEVWHRCRSLISKKAHRLNSVPLRKRIEDDDGLVGAGDDGFGDGYEFLLLGENAKAGSAGSSAVELGSRAGANLGAAGLELRDEDIKFGTVADAMFDDGQNGDAGEIREQVFERDYAVLKFAVAGGFGKIFQL